MAQHSDIPRIARPQWHVIPLSALIVALATGAKADPLPRYDLKLGDWLVYERRAQTFDAESRPAGARVVDQIQVWCFERKADEALLLLDSIRVVDSKPEPMRGAPLTMDTRGVKKLTDEAATRAIALDAAFDVLPVLPASTDDATSWLTPPDPHGWQWRCRIAGPDPQQGNWIEVKFELEDASGRANLLGIARSGHYWFDPQAGVVGRFESRDENHRTGERTGVAIVLRHRVRNEDRWCAQRADETGRLLRELRQEDVVVADVLGGKLPLDAGIDRLERLRSAFVTDFREQSKSPLRILGSGRQQRMPDDIAALRAQAAYAERWVGNVARPWTLPDPSGRSISSEAFRDRPLIECWWSARTITGLRMLDTLRALQREVTDLPLRIVALNLDTEGDLARRAAERCGQGLTHVLAGTLAGKDAPPELPMVRVVQRDGTVRAVLFGWRPSLTAEVIPLLP